MKVPYRTLILMLALGCVHSSRSAWLSSSSVRLQRQDRCVAICAYVDGELQGAECGTRTDFAWSHWIEPGDQIVDHPQLAEWRTALTRLRTLTSDADADPREVAVIAGRIPFAAAVVDILTPWIDDDPQRIAAMLDGVDAIQVSDDFALELAAAARRASFDAERIATWVAHLIEAGHDDAAVVALDHPNAGTAAAIAALAALDDVASSQRRAMFDRAAARLVDNPQHARRILQALDELSQSDEVDAMFALLDGEPLASNEFLVQAARELDARPSSSRRELLRRILDATPDATALDARDLTDALETLRSSDRIDGIRAVLEHEAARPEQVAAILDIVPDLLPSRDREPALLEVLASRFGSDRAVQRACERAATSLSRKARERVLARLRELEQPTSR